MKLRLGWMRLDVGLRIGCVAGLASALLGLTAGAGWAQAPAKAKGVAQLAPPSALPKTNGPRLTAGPTYTSAEGKTNPEFPNVDVVFTLTGADGKPIQPNPGDLKLFSQGTELGTANSIRPFAQTRYGLTAILAIDASGSMRGAPINAIHATIAKFVKQARSQDRVAVITFADETKVDVPFGSSQDALTKDLETVQPRGKFTRLYDGLLDALNQFSSNQPKRRQLVVISDGHDEGSKRSLANVILQANKLNVVIDAIGLTKDRGEYLGSLEQLANDTGGTYSRAMNAQELDKLIDQGIQATQATPVAAFKTEHLAADNAVHSTQLRWKPGNLTATAFVSTPQRRLFRNPLLWVLGGCFVAGVVLLAVSWFGSKSGSKSGVKAGASGAFASGMAPPPPPPVFTPVPTVLTPRKTPTTFEGSSGPVGRTPTLPDTGPIPDGIGDCFGKKPAITTLEPPMAPASTGNAPAKDILGRERNKTRLAAFFEAPERGPYAVIRVQNGAMAGAAVPITATIFSLGALAGNSLILPGDATVSGHHVRFFWEGSILKVEDLNSTNGTFLNSAKLTPGRHLLRPGDELRLGQTVLVLEHV